MSLPDVATVKSILADAGISEVSVDTTGLGVLCRISADGVPTALEALKASESNFVFLVDLFGHDTGEGVDITYHLRSFARDEDLYLRISLPYDGTLASVWEVHPAALMPERETAEMLGLTLSGHPNPKRLLTIDGLDPLLLKRVEIRGAEEVRSR